MESVIDKIRQSREEEAQKRAESNIKETVIDGCQVRMRFGNSNSANILSAIKTMLISAHFDTALAAATSAGGDYA